MANFWIPPKYHNNEGKTFLELQFNVVEYFGMCLAILWVLRNDRNITEVPRILNLPYFTLKKALLGDF